MFIGIRSALVAATILCATPASAATIVQTVSSSSGGAYADRFDFNIGKLNSVSVSSSFYQVLFFQYPFQLGQPVVNASGRLGTSEVGLYDFTGNFQSNMLDPNTISIYIGATATSFTTTDFAPFIGRGSVYLAGLLSSDSSFKVDDVELKRVQPSFPGQAGGRFTVTYDFTPFIPEPATWALMLAGFAMTGYALRRRRAMIAFA